MSICGHTQKRAWSITQNAPLVRISTQVKNIRIGAYLHIQQSNLMHKFDSMGLLPDAGVYWNIYDLHKQRYQFQSVWLRARPFIAISAKTESLRASIFSQAPTNMAIPVILRSILRYLRGPQAELGCIVLGCAKMAILRKMAHYSNCLPKPKLIRLGPLTDIKCQTEYDT